MSLRSSTCLVPLEAVGVTHAPVSATVTFVPVSDHVSSPDRVCFIRHTHTNTHTHILLKLYLKFHLALAL